MMLNMPLRKLIGQLANCATCLDSFLHLAAHPTVNTVHCHLHCRMVILVRLLVVNGELWPPRTLCKSHEGNGINYFFFTNFTTYARLCLVRMSALMEVAA